MNIDVNAFSDELVKIAETRDPVTRERLIRGLKGALAAGAGYGLGYGLGNLAMNVGIPDKIFQIKSPILMGLGGAGLGVLATAAERNLSKEYRNYVAGNDKP